MEDTAADKPIDEGDRMRRYIEENSEELMRQCVPICEREWGNKVDGEEAFQETCMSLTTRPVKIRQSERALFFVAFRNRCKRLAKRNAISTGPAVQLSDALDPGGELQTEQSAKEEQSAVSKEFLRWFESFVPDEALHPYIDPDGERARHHLPPELVRWVIARNRTLSGGEFAPLEAAGVFGRFPREYLRWMHATLKADRYDEGRNL